MGLQGLETHFYLSYIHPPIFPSLRTLFIFVYPDTPICLLVISLALPFCDGQFDLDGGVSFISTTRQLPTMMITA